MPGVGSAIGPRRRMKVGKQLPLDRGVIRDDATIRVGSRLMSPTPNVPQPIPVPVT